MNRLLAEKVGITDQINAARRAVERSCFQAVGMHSIMSKAKHTLIPFLTPRGIAFQNTDTGAVIIHSLTALREEAKGDKESSGAVDVVMAERVHGLEPAKSKEEKEARAKIIADMHRQRIARTPVGARPGATPAQARRRRRRSQGCRSSAHLKAIREKASLADLTPDEQEAWLISRVDHRNDPSPSLERDMD